MTYCRHYMCSGPLDLLVCSPQSFSSHSNIASASISCKLTTLTWLWPYVTILDSHYKRHHRRLFFCVWIISLSLKLFIQDFCILLREIFKYPIGYVYHTIFSHSIDDRYPGSQFDYYIVSVTVGAQVALGIWFQFRCVSVFFTQK